MILKIEEMIAAKRADCSGCEACANICPKGAIEMTRDAEGFAYPKINPELCIQCGRCDATCPALNFKAKEINSLPKVFAAIYEDEKILRHSSSGGIFSALSEIFLKSGGIVFGAGFDKNWRVVHTGAKNFDELENLRGSKYVQSKIGDVYKKVQDALKSTNVLFSGVPCQCAGLKHFLGRDYENLLTVEIICHGVPSPALWENYIDEFSYAHEITSVNFRSKRHGWASLLDINFADKEPITIQTTKNLYGKLFLEGISERPSCSACKFKFPNGQSDLTLGDAWGVKDFLPEMYDSRGVSIVFVHTDKGKNFFEQANLKTQEIKFADAVKKNPRFLSPTVADPRREKFFADLAKNADWFSVMQKYFEDDEKILKETGKKNDAAFKKKFSDVLAQLKKNFAQNILVVSSAREGTEQKNLEKFFEDGLTSCAVYFLQPTGYGQLVCTENFSDEKFDLKDTAALTDFAKQYKISAVCVEKPLNFGDDSSAIIDWLKTCDLPVKLFAQKTK